MCNERCAKGKFKAFPIALLEQLYTEAFDFFK